MEVSQSESTQRMSAIPRLVQSLLRPLVRMTIKVLNYSQFCEIARQVYVEEARNLIHRSGKSRITKSEVSLMTGIDARQFSGGVLADSDLGSKSENGNLAKLLPENLLLGHWVSNKKYCDELGIPKAIWIKGAEGSFEYLVNSYFPRGVTIHSVLSSLVDSGNVELVENEQVILKSQTYLPIGQNANRVIETGLNAVENLLQTIECNSLERTANRKIFQRQVRTLRVSEEMVPGLSIELTKMLQNQFSKSQAYLNKFDQHGGVGDGSQIGIGYYLFKT